MRRDPAPRERIRTSCVQVAAYASSICTEALHLSESEAYLRIAAARASREHPMLLAMLGDGRLHLSGIALLAPHLTPENRDVLLRRAAHRSKRQIEELIAEMAPRADVPALMRKLPERRIPPAAALTAASVATVIPVATAPTLINLAPPTVVLAPPAVPDSPPPSGMVQFTASTALREKHPRGPAPGRARAGRGPLSLRRRVGTALW